MIIGHSTKVANVAATVYVFPWMAPKSTSSFIHSFTYHPKHDMGQFSVYHAHSQISHNNT